jgi:hypothetical protein
MPQNIGFIDLNDINFDICTSAKLSNNTGSLQIIPVESLQNSQKEFDTALCFLVGKHISD